MSRFSSLMTDTEVRYPRAAAAAADLTTDMLGPCWSRDQADWIMPPPGWSVRLILPSDWWMMPGEARLVLSSTLTLLLLLACGEELEVKVGVL